MKPVDIKRAAVLHEIQQGKRPNEIFKVLKNSGIDRKFIWRIYKRCDETGSVEKRNGGGRPRTVRTPAFVKALREKIRRNPCRSQKKLALQLGTSRKTIGKALRDDLGLKALKKTKRHMLTAKQKKARVQKCRSLLRRHAGESWKSILFTDEKIFTVEASLNRQNDRVYARSVADIPSTKRRVIRSHHPGSVMVWCGVSWEGKADLHFVKQGVKVSAKNYLSDVLQPLVEPLNRSLFNGKPWTFQQDSAPAHKAKIVQSWLRNNVPDFISTDE